VVVGGGGGGYGGVLLVLLYRLPPLNPTLFSYPYLSTLE
jgi:hypothetical protein